MSSRSRLDGAFSEALVLPLKRDSKYVLFSDCHRGRGNANDNFLKNKAYYLAALREYEKKGFTYLELGDGDELWENRSLRQIQEVHQDTFLLLAEFFEKGRFYTLYGNHDMSKKNPKFLRAYFDSYRCLKENCETALFPHIVCHEGIILRDEEGGKDVYLTHGHQGDCLNSTFWKLSRFLVRYLWRPLEALGIPDPTSAAKNNKKKKASEEIFVNWARKKGCLLITGHTHHPMIGTRESPYCNTGSCVHPMGITAIEIENRCLALVKWSLGTREDQSLYVQREVLGEPVCLDKYRG